MAHNMIGQMARSTDVGEPTGRPLRATRVRRAFMSGVRSRAVPCIAAVLAAGWAVPAMTWGASAKDVFDDVARSVVVVLAMDNRGVEMSQGSGVVVDDHAVVTNCHVVEGAADVAVRQAADSAGGETYRMAASLLARDDDRDMCLLLVNELAAPPAAPPVRMGTAQSLDVGEDVYAVGAPQGLALSLSRGIVSQLRGAFGKRRAPLIQTDASISPGSSGGGLFNGDGELVGVTTFKWKGENLNFALPVEWVGQLLDQNRVKLAAEKEAAKKRVAQRQAELVAEREAAEKQAACLVHPNYRCVLSLAMETARGIEAGDDRARALTAIVEAQAGHGDKLEARKTLAIAMETAHGIEAGDDRARALRAIAEAQAAIGDIAAALETARGIEDAWRRDAGERAVAEAQATMGDIAAALETARGIEDGGWRALALYAIADAQAKTGDFDAAMETARFVSGAYYRGRFHVCRIFRLQAKTGDIAGALENLNSRVICFTALLEVAEGQAKAGNKQGSETVFAAALETARGMSVDVHCDLQGQCTRAQLLTAIAEAQAKAGNKQGAETTFTAALEAALGIEDARDRASALGTIAEAQAAIGDIAAALKTARGIEEAGDRASTLRAVAAAQVAMGDIAAALEKARGIESARSRASALSAIAAAQAAMGDIAAALKTARGIGEAGDRASALRAIAAVQAAMGDKREARATLANALETARGIEKAEVRALALSAIAAAQAAMGDIAAALETARGIEGAWDRASALLASVLETARGIGSAWFRAEALQSIAKAQAKAGDFVGAMKTAMEIAELRYRTKALAAIATVGEAVVETEQ